MGTASSHNNNAAFHESGLVRLHQQELMRTLPRIWPPEFSGPRHHSIANIPQQNPKLAPLPPPLLLIAAVRDIFNTLGANRIFSAEFVVRLHAREGEPWSEWMGVNGDRKPAHPITQTQLASILHEFEIVPKTVWKPGLRRGIRGTAASGYKREWFEQVWASYCPANAPTRQRTPLMIDTDFKMNAAAADTTIQPFKSLADKALEVLREKRRSFAPRIESRLPSPPSLNLPLALSSSAHCSFPCPLTFPAAFVSFPA